MRVSARGFAMLRSVQHAASLQRLRAGAASRLAATPRSHRAVVTAGISDLFRAAQPAAGRNGRARLTKGVVTPTRPVPPHIPRPPYADSGKMPEYNTTPQVQDAAGIAKMRAAGRLAADILEMAGALVRPGVQTEEIDRAVHEATVAAGAYPSPLNYGAFPKSVCTSVNEVICHGIPDSTVLQEGDIVNVDVTVYLDGHHGDTSRTFLVGSVDPQASQLVEVTRQALEAGIAVCRPGAPFKAIGAAIHALADSHGFGCCPGFCGHGVGKAFHSGPTILHTRNSEPGVMAVGQTFTIEPMLTLTKAGVKERFWDDGWTAVTVDGSWSAQFEHTLLITAGGVEVLTLTQAAATARAAAGAAAPAEPAAAAAAAPARTQAAKPAPAAKQKRRPGGGGKERAWTFE